MEAPTRKKGSAKPNSLPRCTETGVAGARSNALPDHVPEALKEERWHRFMARAQEISAEKLAAKAPVDKGLETVEKG